MILLVLRRERRGVREKDVVVADKAMEALNVLKDIAKKGELKSEKGSIIAKEMVKIIIKECIYESSKNWDDIEIIIKNTEYEEVKKLLRNEMEREIETKIIDKVDVMLLFL